MGKLIFSSCGKFGLNRSCSRQFHPGVHRAVAAKFHDHGAGVVALPRHFQNAAISERNTAGEFAHISRLRRDFDCFESGAQRGDAEIGADNFIRDRRAPGVTVASHIKFIRPLREGGEAERQQSPPAVQEKFEFRHRPLPAQKFEEIEREEE